MLASELIERIPIQTNDLQQYIYRLVDRMIGQIRQNFSKLNSISKQEQADLFSLSNITTDDLKELLKQYTGGGQVMTTPLYTLISLIVNKYIIINDEKSAEYSTLLLSLIMLARLKYRYIRIMDPDIIDTAFGLMNKKTYIGTNGIIWAIYKISRDTLAKYSDQLKNNPNDIYNRYRFIIDIRNKFNQLMKHIARMYYYVVENKDKIFTDDKIQAKVEEIMEYVYGNELNPNIIELIRVASHEKDDTKIYDLKYKFQNDYEVQNELHQLLFILEKLILKYKLDAANQNIETDFTSLEFLRSFIVRCRKSNKIMSLCDKPIYEKNGFSPLLIITFACTIITLWESLTKGNISTKKEEQEDDLSVDNSSELAYEEESFSYLDLEKEDLLAAIRYDSNDS